MRIEYVQGNKFPYCCDGRMVKATGLRSVSVFTAWVRAPLTVCYFLRACGVVVAYLLCKQLEGVRFSSSPFKETRRFRGDNVASYALIIPY